MIYISTKKYVYTKLVSREKRQDIQEGSHIIYTYDVLCRIIAHSSIFSYCVIMNFKIKLNTCITDITKGKVRQLGCTEKRNKYHKSHVEFALATTKANEYFSCHDGTYTRLNAIKVCMRVDTCYRDGMGLMQQIRINQPSQLGSNKHVMKTLSLKMRQAANASPCT